MDEFLLSLRVSSPRLKSDFKTLAEIGGCEDGGVHRPALSDAHLTSRAWFREQIIAAGFEFRLDSAGNHSAFLDCGPPSAPTLLLGSHLDSVPCGGRYDGALGVLAALEVLRVFKKANETDIISFPVNLEAIEFTDEEGTLVGLLGSSALAGKLTVRDLQNPRGSREALLAGLDRAGLTENGLLGARRDPDTLAGYLELHIEQGPRLINTGANMGIFTGIVGIGSYRLTYVGRSDHAGTTPMTDRLDASQGASAFTLGVRHLLLDEFPGCVANVGAMQLKPGAFNIVPSHAILTLEYRTPDLSNFDRLEAALLELAQVEAQRYSLELEIEFLGKHPPVPMNPAVQESIARAADDLGLSSIPLASGAGHDAQSLADLCPTGMIFIPSVGGASHSPREFSQWEDCVNGANVLLQSALRLAQDYT